jgi:FlaA1/EpsC-like NDP-sugar epimerase
MSDWSSSARWKRTTVFLVMDILLMAASLLCAFFLRFESLRLAPQETRILLTWLPLMIVLKILLLLIFGLYNITWSFVGIREFANILKAFTLSLVLSYFGSLYFQTLHAARAVPTSVLLIDFILCIILISAFRISKRVYLEVLRGQSQGKRTLIVGAGPTGERLAREFLRPGLALYTPIGFVDDDPSKLGSRIHGVPVLGRIQDIATILEHNVTEAAILAITTLTHTQVKQIFETLVENGIREIKVVPHISRLPERAVTVKDIQDIHIEDLLYREPVTIDESRVREFLSAKAVLVTGAGGSIGSEIVRQVQKFYPSRVILMDVDETDIFHLLQELKGRANVDTEILPFIGDIRDPETLRKLFSEHRPEVVFHAAAYKHVPMMEHFPDEAVKTNIMGTHNLGRAALAHGVQRFVNISTDKAVNPTSVMGATKRMAEIVCSTLNRMDGTRFISVRFGNVLASRGSVVPLFLKQIQDGGPITVTHPKVQRFFMTIPEAVSLVFQAASMGNGGEVFVLNMGEPVQILQLAEDLIRLNHMEPYKDIKIEFSGLRPGEKLYEELLTAEEGTTATSHEKIHIAKNQAPLSPEMLDNVIAEFDAASKTLPQAVRDLLVKNVPYYFPSA